MTDLLDPQDQPAQNARIMDLWPALNDATKQWFISHPGTVILPRTITTELNRAAGQLLLGDTPGQYRLTNQDQLFIRNLAHSTYAAQGAEHFFDSVQPTATEPQ